MFESYAKWLQGLRFTPARPGRRPRRDRRTTAPGKPELTPEQRLAARQQAAQAGRKWLATLDTGRLPVELARWLEACVGQLTPSEKAYFRRLTEQAPARPPARPAARPQAPADEVPAEVKALARERYARHVPAEPVIPTHLFVAVSPVPPTWEQHHALSRQQARVEWVPVPHPHDVYAAIDRALASFDGPSRTVVFQDVHGWRGDADPKAQTTGWENFQVLAGHLVHRGIGVRVDAGDVPPPADTTFTNYVPNPVPSCHRGRWARTGAGWAWREHRWTPEELLDLRVPWGRPVYWSYDQMKEHGVYQHRHLLVPWEDPDAETRKDDPDVGDPRVARLVYLGDDWDVVWYEPGPRTAAKYRRRTGRFPATLDAKRCHLRFRQVPDAYWRWLWGHPVYCNGVYRQQIRQYLEEFVWEDGDRQLFEGVPAAGLAESDAGEEAPTEFKRSWQDFSAWLRSDAGWGTAFPDQAVEADPSIREDDDSPLEVYGHGFRPDKDDADRDDVVAVDQLEAWQDLVNRMTRPTGLAALDLKVRRLTRIAEGPPAPLTDTDAWSVALALEEAAVSLRDRVTKAALTRDAEKLASLSREAYFGRLLAVQVWNLHRQTVGKHAEKVGAFAAWKALRAELARAWDTVVHGEPEAPRPEPEILWNFEVAERRRQQRAAKREVIAAQGRTAGQSLVNVVNRHPTGICEVPLDQGAPCDAVRREVLETPAVFRVAGVDGLPSLEELLAPERTYVPFFGPRRLKRREFAEQLREAREDQAARQALESRRR